jgi:hypothetical protein
VAAGPDSQPSGKLVPPLRAAILGIHPRAGARALALLATLGLAGTSAARHALGLDGPSGPTASAASVPWAGDRTGTVVASRAPLRLAASDENGFGALLDSLFGPPQREPRRARPPVRQRRAPLPEMRFAPPPMVAPPQITPPAPVTMPEPGDEGVATYRTVCVRLCDGYYWPISFATTTDNFERDENVCTRSCGSPAHLYYHLNPGGAPEEMLSLDGTPYTDLGNAFLYRSTYDPGCKCRPHPWEAESIERHKAYAGASEVRAASRTRRSR